MNNKLTLSLIMYVFLMSVSCVSAQVTLDSCRYWSKVNYPTVKKYDLIRLSEQYNVSNAVREWIPKVGFSAQATWQTDAAQYPDALKDILFTLGSDVQGMRQDQYKLALDISQNIWDGGKSSANKMIAQKQTQVDIASADVDLYSLNERVDNLYFGIVLLEEQKQQTSNMISLIEDNLHRVKVMVANEVLLPSEADEIEVGLLSANQHLSYIEYSISAYRQMLSILCDYDLSAAILSIPEEIDYDININHRPELSLLDAQSDLISAQKKLIRSASMPQFNLFVQGWYGYPGLNMFENMMNADWSWNAIAGIRLQWNISAYYTQRNRINQLKIQQQQLEIQRDIFNFNNSLQLTQQNTEIIRIKQQINADMRIVELRKKVRQSAENKFQNGIINASELLQKITDEASAKSNLSLHKIELLQKEYSLKNLTNN